MNRASWNEEGGAWKWKGWRENCWKEKREFGPDVNKDVLCWGQRQTGQCGELRRTGGSWEGRGHGANGAGLGLGTHSCSLLKACELANPRRQGREGLGLCGEPPVFLTQGMLALVLNCIDRLNVYTTAAHFAEFAGEEAAESWKEIVNLLYELLGKGPQVLTLPRAP